jgi:hypothetical protein
VFTLVGATENNFFMKIAGTVAQAEKTFYMQINNYQYHGMTYRSNAADLNVSDPSGGNIADVTELDNASDYHPFLEH